MKYDDQVGFSRYDFIGRPLNTGEAYNEDPIPEATDTQDNFNDNYPPGEAPVPPKPNAHPEMTPTIYTMADVEEEPHTIPQEIKKVNWKNGLMWAAGGFLLAKMFSK